MSDPITARPPTFADGERDKGGDISSRPITPTEGPMTNTKDPATMTRAERIALMRVAECQQNTNRLHLHTLFEAIDRALFPPRTREVPACVKWRDKTVTWGAHGYAVTWTSCYTHAYPTLRSLLMNTVLPEDPDEILRVVTALRALPTAKPTIEVIDDD